MLHTVAMTTKRQDSKTPHAPDSEIEQLELLNRSMQNAFAFTGHEWRRHLTLLHLAVEKMLREVDGPLTEGQRITIEHAHDAVSRMDSISQAYLDLARVSGTNVKLQYSFVNPIRDVFTPLQAQFGPMLEKSQQKLTVACENPDLLLWVDKGLLTSVYENLLSNAIKYGEQNGYIVVEIIERGNKDQISVLNNGMGIPHAKLDAIFEQFVRADSSEPGNGIGLYLARQIVEAHGGRLWAESLLGAWAKFTFTLPKYTAG